jgi:hypothetical protein
MAVALARVAEAATVAGKGLWVVAQAMVGGRWCRAGMAVVQVVGVLVGAAVWVERQKGVAAVAVGWVVGTLYQADKAAAVVTGVGVWAEAQAGAAMAAAEEHLQVGRLRAVASIAQQQVCAKQQHARFLQQGIGRCKLSRGLQATTLALLTRYAGELLNVDLADVGPGGSAVDCKPAIPAREDAGWGKDGGEGGDKHSQVQMNRRMGAARAGAGAEQRQAQVQAGPTAHLFAPEVLLNMVALLMSAVTFEVSGSSHGMAPMYQSYATLLLAARQV